MASSSRGAEGCCDLRGLWTNYHGSFMRIRQDVDFRICGEYSCSPKTTPRETPSPLAGVVKAVEGGSLVSWNVIWSGGKSMTTWVGQCMPQEDGSKVIFATWLLKTTEEKWASHRIGQDTFRLVNPDKPKPTQHLLPSNTNLELVGLNEGLVGRWRSLDGSELCKIDLAAKTGNVKGWYAEKLSEEEGDLFGLTTYYEKEYVALAFSSAAGEHTVKGWTGYVHDPETQAEDPYAVMMETSWITHAFSPKLHSPRCFVHFGMDLYKMERPPVSTSDSSPCSGVQRCHFYNIASLE